MFPRSIPTTVRAIALSVVLVTTGACGPNGLQVQVSALRDPTRTGRTYWLVPAGKGIDATRLEYRNAEWLAHKALRARGYQLVDRNTEPHLVIRLGYGVGPPSGARVTWNQWTLRADAVTFYTTWVRLSAVDGKSFAGGRPADEVWSTTALTNDRSRDVNLLIPVLLASAMDYLGPDRPRNVRLTVPPDSQRVKWLVAGGS